MGCGFGHDLCNAGRSGRSALQAVAHAFPLGRVRRQLDPDLLHPARVQIAQHGKQIVRGGAGLFGLLAPEHAGPALGCTTRPQPQVVGMGAQACRRWAKVAASIKRTLARGA